MRSTQPLFSPTSRRLERGRTLTRLYKTALACIEQGEKQPKQNSSIAAIPLERRGMRAAHDVPSPNETLPVLGVALVADWGTTQRPGELAEGRRCRSHATGAFIAVGFVRDAAPCQELSDARGRERQLVNPFNSSPGG